MIRVKQQKDSTSLCTRGNRNQIGVCTFLHRMSTLDVHGCGVVSIKKLVRLGTGNFALKKILNRSLATL